MKNFLFVLLVGVVLFCSACQQEPVKSGGSETEQSKKAKGSYDDGSYNY